MKFILYALMLVALGVRAQNSLAIDKINSLIVAGKCSEAEYYARSNIYPPAMQTALGIISMDCKKNKTEAIGYFKIAANQGETVAIEMLSSMGISIARPRASGIESPLVIEGPPPHDFSPPPRANGNIIILQPQQLPLVNMQPGFNPSACIQDGGGTFCPNHPNTQIRPFNPFGR